MSRRAILDGTTVLDLGRVIASPFATQILADLGATVIKVEQPGKGDDARKYGDLRVDGKHVSALFVSLNRSKQSIALDIKKGGTVLRRLVRGADVLIHNFRPGVAERLGIDYPTLRRVNRRLVYCSVSGFGDVGPLRTKAGNDLIAQAYSGLMSFTGEADGAPVRCPISIADLTTGLYAAIGILAALLDRDRTGRGREVRTSLLESMVSLIDHHLTETILTGRPPRKLGSANLLGQPNQAFATRDGWVVISAVSDRMFDRCCEALGLLRLTSDARFSTLAARYKNREELIHTVGDRVKRMSTRQCVSALESKGVACSPINDLTTLASDIQVASTELLENVDYDGIRVPVVGTPLLFNGSRSRARSGPPTLGANTRTVLADAGYRPSQIDKMREAGIVA